MCSMSFKPSPSLTFYDLHKFFLLIRNSKNLPLAVEAFVKWNLTTWEKGIAIHLTKYKKSYSINRLTGYFILRPFSAHASLSIAASSFLSRYTPEK